MSGEIFKRAIDKVSELSPAQQDEIGSMILVELEDEARWTEAFRSSQAELEKMAEDAIMDFRSGKVKPMPCDPAV